QQCQQLPVGAVRLVLQAVDLDPVLGELIADVRQLGHGPGSQLRGALQDGDLVGDALGQVVYPVEHDQVPGRLHVVHAVVQCGGQVVDVVPVEGSDEGVVQPAHDRVRAVVGLVFDLLEFLGVTGAFSRGSAGQLCEEIGAFDQVARRGGQQVEERRIAGGQAKAQDRLRNFGVSTRTG